jgi:hypothetical protein
MTPTDRARERAVLLLEQVAIALVSNNEDVEKPITLIAAALRREREEAVKASESGQGEAIRYIGPGALPKEQIDIHIIRRYLDNTPRKSITDKQERLLAIASLDRISALLAARRPESAVTMGCMNPLASTGPKETWAGLQARAEKAEGEAKTLRSLLAKVQDEMEASGGWDGDDALFSEIYATLASAPEKPTLREDDSE